MVMFFRRLEEKRWQRLMAVFACAAVIAIRYWLHPMLGDYAPFFLGALGVTLSAYVGGFWLGMAALAVTTAAGALLFSEPATFQTIAFQVALTNQLVVGTCISGVCHALRVSQRQKEQMAEQERDARFRLSSLFNSITDKVLVLSPDLRLINANEAAAVKWNLGPDAIGKPCQEVIPASMYESLLPSFLETASTHQSLTAAVTETDTQTSYDVRVFPNDQGTLVYIHNTTELREASAAISKLMQDQAQITAHLDSLLTHAPIGFAFFDQEYRFTRLNSAIAAMNGVNLDDHIGKTVREIVPMNALAMEPVIAEVFRTGVAVERMEVIGETSREPGVQRHWHTGIYPVTDDSGKVVSVGVVVIEITDTKKIEENLRSSLANERLARSDAEQANRMKDEFLTILSHELRTPLTTMVGWTEILLKSAPADSELVEGLQAIERSSRLQLQLINDLLDMSRISVGKINLEFEFADLFDTVKSAVDLVLHSADSKSIVVTLDGPPAGIVVRIDPDRFTQVIWNLLSNAIKFTPSVGHVEISVGVKGDSAFVRVTDSGVGLDAAFIPHIFERFRQADPSRSRRHGGLGLGLAIAKQLADLHGGIIDVQSKGPGLGSQFTVSIPMVSFPPMPHAPVIARPATDLRAPNHLKGHRILLVEDDYSSAVVLQRALSIVGAEVTAVANASEAREKYREGKPDLIISDIGLPDEDGLELIKSLRTLESSTSFRVPAIALTAFASSSDRADAIAAGFDAYMTKPVVTDDLIRCINQVMTPGTSDPDC